MENSQNKICCKISFLAEIHLFGYVLCVVWTGGAIHYTISAADTHDMVLRFNHAPTIGYETDVGMKTTLRIVNSQVVSKPSFNFMTSPLYQNVILLAWDPSNYSSTLEQVCVMLGCHCSVIGYILLVQTRL